MTTTVRVTVFDVVTVTVGGGVAVVVVPVVAVVPVVPVVDAVVPVVDAVVPVVDAVVPVVVSAELAFAPFTMLADAKPMTPSTTKQTRSLRSRRTSTSLGAFREAFSRAPQRKRVHRVAYGNFTNDHSLTYARSSFAIPGPSGREIGGKR
jgi:hypothetical protein